MKTIYVRNSRGEYMVVQRPTVLVRLVGRSIIIIADAGLTLDVVILHGNATREDELWRFENGVGVFSLPITRIIEEVP